MLLKPSDVAPEPWRNGAGATRELAVGTDPAGQMLWRVSLADLDADAHFSSYPDTDRLLTTLGDLRLTIDGAVVRLRSGGQVRFAGEAPVSVAVDRPTRVLNVMTRRGRCAAEVVLRPVREPIADSATARVQLGDLAADILLTTMIEETCD